MEDVNITDVVGKKIQIQTVDKKEYCGIVHTIDPVTSVLILSMCILRF